MSDKSTIQTSAEPELKDKDAAENENLEKFEEMFKAGVHYGYSKTKRNPKMTPFIYGAKNNVEIFDLEKTFDFLGEALLFMKKMSEEKKQILFVGTKPGVNEVVKKAAHELNMPYVSTRWIGGTLTNFKAIRSRVNEYEKIKKDIESENLQKYTKKERVRIIKEFARMEKKFNGLVKLISLPAALFAVDPKEEDTAVREAKRLLIPVLAVMNTDTDPTGIKYPIPANDAAVRSVEYLIGKIVEAYKTEIKKE